MRELEEKHREWRVITKTSRTRQKNNIKNERERIRRRTSRIKIDLKRKHRNERRQSTGKLRIENAKE